MEAKSRSTSIKKTDKGTPASGGDKKEGSIKEQANPASKKTAATGDSAPTNHDVSKPAVPEPQGPVATSENKTNEEEEHDDSSGGAEGSSYEGLKPLLVAAGVAVAAIAVIVGVVFLARKK